jgi:hypothetical protein
MRQQGRHFQRHPAVHAVGPVVNRPEQVGGARNVLQRELEEERLAGFAPAHLLADGGVVIRAVLDGVVEDRRIRRQPGYGELVDVAFERTAVQQVAGNVVEPDALAQVVQQLCRFHLVASVLRCFSISRKCPLKNSNTSASTWRNLQYQTVRACGSLDCLWLYL